MKLREKLRLVPIQDLRPYPHNAKKHSKEQIYLIEESLRRNDYYQPIAVDKDNVIVVGHGRFEALKNINPNQKIEVVDLSYLSPEEIKKLRILDNKIVSNEWDKEALEEEIRSLYESLEDDIEKICLETAMDIAEISRLLPEETLGDDDLPENVPAISKLGDFWELGEHRLICGDATSVETTEKLFKNQVPKIMVTDPPYGVQYDPTWRGKVVGQKVVQKGLVRNDTETLWQAAYKLFPGEVMYVWHSGIYSADFASSIAESGFEVRSQIIWVKQSPVISRGHYHWQHEPCYYAVRKGSKAYWRGDRKETTVWEIANLNSAKQGAENEKMGHGTQKPLECMARPIRNHTLLGEVIYEPFLGSGTTLIAAEKLSRKCFAVELDPAYCDLSVLRYKKFCESNGKSFSARLNGKAFSFKNAVKESKPKEKTVASKKTSKDSL